MEHAKMDKEALISLDEAKEQFTKLMYSVNSIHRDCLLSFAIKEFITARLDESDEGSYNADDLIDDPAVMLNSIAKEIRCRVPLDAVFPSENIMPPKNGQNSDCDPNITKHVDAFLYNDEELENLIKDGKFTRNYCLDCGSKNTKPLILISHSTSREDLYQIFNRLLPTLDEQTVLDVGSRLGAVLYGAYAYTDASRIIGVEMNKEWSDLQTEIVQKYKMDKRIEIINKRIEDCPEIIKSADVVILNNVFEFYLSKSEETEIWRFIRANVKSGAYIISRPNLEMALSNLDTGIVIDEWLKSETPSNLSKNPFDLLNNEEDDKSFDIACYVVL